MEPKIKLILAILTDNLVERFDCIRLSLKPLFSRNYYEH